MRMQRVMLFAAWIIIGMSVTVKVRNNYEGAKNTAWYLKQYHAV